MNDDDIIKFQENLEKKLGKENMALIADDVGTLITKNAEAQKQIEEQSKSVSDLKTRNEQLIAANGNLIKQVAVSNTDNERPDNFANDEKENKPFRLKDAFDQKGHFKE